MIFLKRIPLLLLCIILIFIGIDSSILCEEVSSNLQRYEFESPQMGLPFRLVLYSNRGNSHTSNAADQVWNRISSLNRVLSNYETDSELSQLGYGAGKGNWVVVSDDFWAVLAQAQKLSVSSDGVFDFTLGPATSLWRKVRREKKLPAPNVLDSMMHRTGWQHLVMRPEDQSVCLTMPGMRLDPGGIAKGFALDEALKVLGPLGITSALISGGGDMVVLDPPPDSPGWQIRLAEFENSKEDASIIHLAHGAIATSGDLFQYVDIEGKRYSHILNPKTGLGLTRRILVSVIAPTGMEADSLATTLSVLGPEKTPAWLDQHAPHVQVRMLLVNQNDRVDQWQTDLFGN